MHLFLNIRRWYNNLKLQSRFTLVLLLIATLPALLIALFFYSRINEMVVSYTIKQEQDHSARTAPIIEASVNEILELSEKISSQAFYGTFFKNAHSDLASPSARTAFSEHHTASAASFLSAVDSLVQNSSASNVRFYLEISDEIRDSLSFLFQEKTDHALFETADRIQGTYWHGIFHGSHVSELFCPPFYLGTQEQKALGDLAYIRHVPLIFGGTTYDAYMAVYYSSEDFQKILSENLALEGSVSYIVNNRNNLVASSDPSLSGIYWLNYDNIRESSLSSNSFIKQEILGQTVYVGFYRIRKPEWFMVTVLPSQPLLRQSQRLILQFIVIYLLILMLAFFLAMLLSRSITNRISSVITRMRAVRQGPPVPMDSPTSHDEIGDLIDTYNYMTRKMNQLMEKQAKAAEDLRIAEFNSLQAQINPHFLYNTMDMINWMALQGQTDEISTAVQNLSRFYKLTLSKKNSISTIAREEEHVSIYVRLQNMRYHDQISLISDIPDELMEYQIPKLTLQPAVENAILHGILEKPSKTGTIVLTGWKENEDIVLLISDDGVGIPADKLPVILSGDGSSSSGGTNIAIYNTHRRLQILYGPQYGLSYSSTPGEGTEVEIRLPGKK